MTKKKPAPWELSGDGYIFVFKFSKDFVEKNGFLPKNLKESFDGSRIAFYSGEIRFS